MSVIDQSAITCWNCGGVKAEIMPTNAGQFFDPCNGCGEAMRPKPGGATSFDRMALCHARRSRLSV